MIIGTQGCTYHCGLVLNGPYRGRVVYVEDGSFQLPRFTYESHFLDWYERWLDDILEGNLTVENSGTFGYQMGGTVKHLLAVYLEADSSTKKTEALQGLMFKTLIDKETLDVLSFDLDEQVAKVRYLIIALYMIHDYERSVGHLNKLFEEDLTAALLLLKDYAGNHIVEWVERVKDAMIRISDEATFHAATSILLEDPEQDFECLRPFALHENNRIRIRTFGVLKTLKDKKPYEEVFLKGLDARERHEIIAVLRSLGDLKSKALLDKLKELVSVFPFMEIEPDEDGLKMITEHTHELVFISSNIAMALDAYGLDYDSFTF